MEGLTEAREVSFITNMEDAVSSCVNHVLFDSYHGYTSKSVFMYILTWGICGRTLETLF